MGNFIDKTFTVIADILLKVLPASKKEKEAFSAYRVGMSLQSKGRYNEAIMYYYLALELEEDPYDRSYILYNLGLINQNIGKYSYALDFYYLALLCNPGLSQVWYNMGIVFHSQAVKALALDRDNGTEVSKKLYDKAAEYWKEALRLAPDNYPAARTWLRLTGRLDDEDIL